MFETIRFFYRAVCLYSISLLSFFYSFLQEGEMANNDLKKILAGLGVAGLITAGGITLPGAHAAGSG